MQLKLLASPYEPLLAFNYIQSLGQTGFWLTIDIIDRRRSADTVYQLLYRDKAFTKPAFQP